jgi:hypothetical protein
VGGDGGKSETKRANRPSKVIQKGFVEVILSIGEIGEEGGDQEGYQSANDELYRGGKSGRMDWEEFASTQELIDLLEGMLSCPATNSDTMVLGLLFINCRE